MKSQKHGPRVVEAPHRSHHTILAQTDSMINKSGSQTASCRRRTFLRSVRKIATLGSQLRTITATWPTGWNSILMRRPTSGRPRRRPRGSRASGTCGRPVRWMSSCVVNKRANRAYRSDVKCHSPDSRRMPSRSASRLSLRPQRFRVGCSRLIPPSAPSTGGGSCCAAGS